MKANYDEDYDGEKGVDNIEDCLSPCQPRYIVE
jgi:hypothetical protein